MIIDILVISNQSDYEINQIDVKTVIFNGYLKEEVYQQIPDMLKMVWFVGLMDHFMDINSHINVGIIA